jgi:hypothetical protein
MRRDDRIVELGAWGFDGVFETLNAEEEIGADDEHCNQGR